MHDDGQKLSRQTLRLQAVERIESGVRVAEVAATLGFNLERFGIVDREPYLGE